MKGGYVHRCVHLRQFEVVLLRIAVAVDHAVGALLGFLRQPVSDQASHTSKSQKSEWVVTSIRISFRPSFR